MGDTHDTKTIVARFFEIFSRGDIPALLDAMTDDASWWVSGRLQGMSGRYDKASFGPLVDGAKALDFYCRFFGWSKTSDFDMGPMGVYQLFATGGVPIGGMVKRQPAIPHPFWNHYFTVAGLDATLERVARAGGKIAHGPVEVPGGAWIAQCFDPQGAFFSLVAAKR